jgi:hypothetical protein
MNRRRWRPCAVLMATLLLSGPLIASDATLRRDASLNSSPQPGASVIADLTAGASVSVKQRKGLWAEACTDQLCGWIRVTTLAMARAGSSTSSSLAGLKSGREGAGNAVSSSGVRGLDATSIELSEPDYAALAALESAQVSVNGATGFAAERNLEDRSLALLMAPMVADISAEPSSQSSRAASPSVKKKSKPNPEKDASDDDW